MTILIKYLMKYAKEILISILVFSMLYIGYNKVKTIGYNEAATEHQILIDAQKLLIDNKILGVERLAERLALQTRANNIALSKDIKAITTELKGKTLTILKEGECLPSPSVAESIILINTRTNESIRGQK